MAARAARVESVGERVDAQLAHELLGPKRMFDHYFLRAQRHPGRTAGERLARRVFSRNDPATTLIDVAQFARRIEIGARPVVI